MADRKLKLRVLTPQRTVLEREADFVLLRSVEGDIGILPQHEPCAVQLDYGVLRADEDKRTVAMLAVMGGYATVQDDEVVVLSPVAEPPDRIEERLAEMERERLANQERERTADLEVQRMEAALRHTLVKLEVSTLPLLHKEDE